MNLLASMRYLVALNEHRHFGRAALASHITQPALSNALRALEREFGVLIVKRGRTFAGLTAEGEAVLSTARRMLHEQELLIERLGSEANLPGGTLRLAAVPTATPILARFAVELQRRHPGITPTVLSMSSQEIETALDGMAVDMALGYIGRTQVREVSLMVWPQFVERYYFVRRLPPARRPRAPGVHAGEPMRWDEAAQQPLCLLTSDMHNRAIVDSAFREAGCTVRPAMDTNSIYTLTSTISAGALAGVLPDVTLELLHGGVFEARPLLQPTLETPLGFMSYRSDRVSRALEAAIALLQDAQWLESLRGLSAPTLLP
ncbi:MAG: LysR family transcriptional regulator [Comamonadaceae bacterium]|nr:MAG: LysR family transcriptional regulator [Comamonadaceae bacterium]